MPIEEIDLTKFVKTLNGYLTEEIDLTKFVKTLNGYLTEEIDGILNPRESVFTKYVKRPFYGCLHRIGVWLKNDRLAYWAYFKLKSTYPDSVLGFYRFAAEYMGFNLTELMGESGKIEISAHIA